MSGEDYEISAIISNQEPPKEFSWASEEEAKTGIIIKKMKQKPKQASTSSEVLAHMNQSGTSQAGNVPLTKTPATAKEKKQLADKKFRIKQKIMKEALERDVEQLKRENEKLRRENEDLTRSYHLVKECLQRVNSETEKSSIQLCQLKLENGCQRILVDKFAQKMLASNVERYKCQRLKNELDSLLVNVVWEDWMAEKLGYLNALKLLTNQVRSLEKQVKALGEKIYRQGEEAGTSCEGQKRQN